MWTKENACYSVAHTIWKGMIKKKKGDAVIILDAA